MNPVAACAEFAATLPHAARIASIHDEAEDTRTFVLRLAPPVPALDAACPGQFVMLSLLGYGEAAFTLAHLPRAGAASGTVTLTVRRVGALTRALFACEVGRPAGVRGPFGRGFPVDGADRPTIYVAGGCGLAPLRSAIDGQLRMRPAGTPVAVLYGARTPQSRILRASLADWRARPDVALFETVEDAAPGWRGRTGVVTGHVAEAVATVRAERAALCGPPGMLREAAAALGAAGLPPDAIHVALERYMKCGTGLCGHCYVNDRYVCRDGPVFSYAELLARPDAFGAGEAPRA
ncbi:MAG: FAD/NAD(P)-binding protein [Deltaproteobacteria bacterium]|nr:FAD/NAD(P)-binding protein [Deltaproteobacteria bacterium]